MLWALALKSHIILENIKAPDFKWEVCSFYHSGDRHALFDYRVLQAQVQSLADCGIIWIERKSREGAIAWQPTYALPVHKQELATTLPPASPTSVVIKEIIESPVDSRALAPKKGQAMPAIEGFTTLVLVLLAVIKPSPGFI